MEKNFNINRRKTIVYNNLKVNSFIKFCFSSLIAFFIGNCFMFTYCNFFILPFMLNMIYKTRRDFYISIFMIGIGIIVNYYNITVGFNYTSVVINSSILIKHFTALMLTIILHHYITNYRVKLSNFRKAYIGSIISFSSSLILLFYYSFSPYHIYLAILESAFVFLFTFFLKDGINIITLNKIRRKTFTEKELLSLGLIFLVVMISLGSYTIFTISVSQVLLYTFLFTIGYYYKGARSFFICYIITFMYGVFAKDFTLGQITLVSLTIASVSLLNTKNKYLYGFGYLFLYILFYSLNSKTYFDSLNLFKNYKDICIAVFFFLIIDLKIFDDITKKNPNINVEDNFEYITIDKMKKNIAFGTVQIFNSYKNILRSLNTKIVIDEVNPFSDSEKTLSLKSFIENQQKLNMEVFEKISKEVFLDFDKFSKEEAKVQHFLNKNDIQVETVLIKDIEGFLEITIVVKNYSDNYKNSLNIVSLTEKILNKRFFISNTTLGTNTSTYVIKLNEKPKFSYIIEKLHLAKENNKFSGDNFTILELPRGKTYIALADGMGSGKEASGFSTNALDMLEELLYTTNNIEGALGFINDISVVNGNGESFTTLDIIEVDRHRGSIKNIKFGAPPTFLIRNGRVRKISKNSLPIGVMSNISYEEKTLTIRDKDIIIMMTDGIYEADKDSVDKDEWIMEFLEKNHTRRLKDICSLLKEKALIMSGSNIPKDDILIMAIKFIN